MPGGSGSSHEPLPALGGDLGSGIWDLEPLGGQDLGSGAPGGPGSGIWRGIGAPGGLVVGGLGGMGVQDGW